MPWSSAVVPGLLAARTRHAGLRRILVACAVAVAAILPVLAAALTVTTADAALRSGLAALPEGERSIIATYNGLLDADELADLDAAIRTNLPRLTSSPVNRQLIFRPIADTRGGDYVVGAADNLPAAVELVDGRLPSGCAPNRCEVVSLSAPGEDPYLDPALGLDIVGHAQRTDPLLLTGSFDPGAGATVLLAEGVEQAGAISSLVLRPRTVGWVAGLDIGAVRHLGVERWLTESARVADDLYIARPGLTLTTIDDVLRSENRRAQASASRFAVLGGSTAVLLLGTAVIGGAALRRDHEAFVGALRRRGAGPGTRRLLLLGEVAIATFVGLVLGLLAGATLAALVASRAGLDAAAVAAQSIGAALPVVLALGVVGAGLLALTLAAPSGPGGSTPAGLWRTVEAFAVIAVAVAVLLAARGGVGAGDGSGASPTSGSRDPLLSVLPVLLLVAGALVVARVWPGLTRLAQRALPRGAIAARLGLAAASGRPLRPAATAAVLTAAVASSVFAGSYWATLDRGAADQAAFTVPTDARLEVGRELVRPLDAAPPDVVERLVPGARAHPVLRAAGSVRISAAEGDGLRLLGIDPAVLTHVERWRAVTGGAVGPADLASRLEVPTGAIPSGTALAPGTQMTLTTTGQPVRVAVTAVVRADDGREIGVPLAVSPPGRPQALTADLTAQVGDAAGPANWRDAAGDPVPLHLVAITLRQATDEATRTQHALGERTRDLTVPNGSFGVAGVNVDGTPVPRPWEGWAGEGLQVSEDAESAVVNYRITTGRVVLTARSGGPGTPQSPLAVAVDPATAHMAQDGLITIVLGQRPVAARVVSVLERFPTMPAGRFAVTDVAALGRLLDLGSPSSGTPTELWVDLPHGLSAAADPGPATSVLAQPPLDRLAIRERTVVEASLRADPIAVGAREVLASGALLALLVAVAALVLLVAAEASDDRGQSYAWEADGVAPSTLRGALWWRAVAVVVPAVPAGVVIGVALSRVTSTLVAVTATASTPRPPLVPGTGVGWGVGVAALGVLLGLLVAGVVALAALREPLPVPDAGVLR